MSFCLPSTPAVAQNFTEGSVWRVLQYDILPGKDADFWRDFRMNLKPTYEGDKGAGIIRSYQMYTRQTANAPDAWNVMVRLEYANWAALDGLAEKQDPITLKVYGSAQARTAAAAKRTEFRRTVANILVRQVTPLDLAR